MNSIEIKIVLLGDSGKNNLKSRSREIKLSLKICVKQI